MNSNEENIDFVAFAKDVVSEFRESVEREGTSQYVNIPLFVAITENEGIRTSSRPHVLTNATECIVILAYNAKAITNYYMWYAIMHIDANGDVHKGYQKDGWTIGIESFGQLSNQRIFIRKISSTKTPFSLGRGIDSNPWDEPMHEIWPIFCMMTKCKTEREIELLVENFDLRKELKELDSKNKEEELTIRILEKEREQYMSLLDAIKNMVNLNNS